MKILTLLALTLTLTACATTPSFDPVKAQDYQARDTVYCGGKENIQKYVDLGDYVILACTDGKALMIEKEKSLLEKLSGFLR